MCNTNYRFNDTFRIVKMMSQSHCGSIQERNIFFIEFRLILRINLEI